jgi:hypothetical protein
LTEVNHTDKPSEALAKPWDNGVECWRSTKKVFEPEVEELPMGNMGEELVIATEVE